MSEGRQVSKKAIDAINARPRAKAIKLPGGVFLETGTPDVHATVDGQSFWLESKRGGGAEAIQKKRLREWREAGAVVGVIYSKDEAMRIIDGDETMRAEALRRAEIEP